MAVKRQPFLFMQIDHTSLHPESESGLKPV